MKRRRPKSVRLELTSEQCERFAAAAELFQAAHDTFSEAQWNFVGADVAHLMGAILAGDVYEHHQRGVHSGDDPLFDLIVDVWPEEHLISRSFTTVSRWKPHGGGG